MQIMKSLIIGSFPNKVSSYSPSLPDSYTSLISTGSFHVSLRASKLKQSQPNLVRYSNGSFNESSLLSRKCNTRHVANAVSEQPMEPDSTNPQNSLPNALNAFYRFSRPHTVIGTAIVAAFFMNIYIVGLNQLSDIEIDKVNKPYLPLASGEYSVQTGVIIVSSFAVMSFWLGWIVGSWPLFCALLISFLLGTAYSINVPMLRWKRFALVAAMCILATFVYGRLAVFPKSVIFATGFMSFFSVDIPDIVGDKIFGIQSFTVRLGQKRVFWICILLLEVAYGVAILVGASSPFLWSRYITILGHAILGLILWGRAKSTDLDSKSAITSFYMFIWQLFYAEYLLIPLVR
ncbi:UbiA prenyltransferase family [Cynara cardunculus var. scolymus]|uniref:UbiA prenyltransferase family n=1 Tax=Cynara cardunculus var. scolymus TaxID=59895 RepID=A0A103XMV5_CYNCS|nr:UbiA prenyltransferase family [Cynara cardunculus var. scolymus]